jgi:hypothetical protein
MILGSVQLATAWERLLVTARYFDLGEAAEQYARRAGQETVRSPLECLEDAAMLIRAGQGELVEVSAVCASATLKPTYVSTALPQVFFLVDLAFGAAVSATKTSLELRTPPELWRVAPPAALFSAPPPEQDVLKRHLDESR